MGTDRSLVNSQTHAPSAAHPGYRTDIDGLRAIAVSSVIGFHTFPALFPGGFVGVDVFFVISGYLITGILLRNLRERRFSFLDFYGRRIRRIFPALPGSCCSAASSPTLQPSADDRCHSFR